MSLFHCRSALGDLTRKVLDGRFSPPVFSANRTAAGLLALGLMPIVAAAAPVDAPTWSTGPMTATTQANAATRASIQTLQTGRAVLIQSAPLDASNELITIDLNGGLKQISFIFSTTSDQDHLWQRLWFSKGANSIDKTEQQTLRSEYQALLTETHHELPRADVARIEAGLDFLAYFMPIGEKLTPFDRNVSLPVGLMARYQTTAISQVLENRYTLICDSIGSEHAATYMNLANQPVTKTVLVGAVDSRCRGRCGTGCEQAGQWRHNQYTQECLNHDLCRDEMGSILGPCESEFWKAAPGYLFAPDCTQQAIVASSSGDPSSPPTTNEVPTPPVTQAQLKQPK